MYEPAKGQRTLAVELVPVAVVVLVVVVPVVVVPVVVVPVVVVQVVVPVVAAPVVPVAPVGVVAAPVVALVESDPLEQAARLAISKTATRALISTLSVLDVISTPGEFVIGD